jgi:hypothetical protein
MRIVRDHKSDHDPSRSCTLAEQMGPRVPALLVRNPNRDVGLRAEQQRT